MTTFFALSAEKIFNQNENLLTLICLMESSKIIALLFFIAINVVGLQAQNHQLKERKHLLKTSATISPGFLLQESPTNIYLHGFLEYYLSNKISLRGDAFYYINQHTTPFFKQNHSISWGGLYHFVEGKFDPYIGLQPGINITSIYFFTDDEILASDTNVVPILSINAGANYFISKYFHVFFSTTYIHGKYLNIFTQNALNEIRLSFGLGFNLQVKN